MKKLKFLPTILMLVLCVGILAIGIYAIKPTENKISGSITVNASNTPVKIEVLKNGVLEKTYNSVRGGITWDNLALEFNTESANTPSDVDELKLTLRVTNLSTTQSLGIYFHQGTLPTQDGVVGTETEGIKAGYASADNIMVEDEIFDATTTTDKIADVVLTPYSYLAKNDDNTDNNTAFDVIEMDISFALSNLYDTDKTNTFAYQLNIEPYVGNMDKDSLKVGAECKDPVSYDYYYNPGTEFYGKFLKINDDADLTTIPAMAFAGNETIEHIVIPTNVTLFDLGPNYYDDGYCCACFDANNLKSVSICSDAYQYDDETDRYNIFSDSLTFVKLNGMENISAALLSYATSLKRVDIPSTVTSIGEKAFYNCSSLTSIEIPSGVTSIFYSFDGCSSLTSIDLSGCKNLTSIEFSAFSSCISLTSIELPSGVTSIESDAFYNCDSLVNMDLSGCTNLTSIGWNSFGDCDSLTSITIPDSIASIDGYAFDNCTFTEVKYSTSGEGYTFTDGVLDVTTQAALDTHAWRNWAPLILSVNLPSDITSIGNSAFSDCSSLTSIEIPSSVDTIHSFAFSDCSVLRIKVSEENTNFSSDAQGALYNKDKTKLIRGVNLSTFVIPSGVTSIGSRAFYYFDSLTSIEFPNSLISIDICAFSDCSSLTNINFNNCVNLRSIGSFAFSNCDSLTNVDLNGCTNLTSIEDEAFSYCSKLTSITIPISVTSIGDGAFFDCRLLTSVDFNLYDWPALTSIGEMAFYNCSSLTSIDIPFEVTNVGVGAFDDCSRLARIMVAHGTAKTFTCTLPYAYTLNGTTACAAGTAIAKVAERDNIYTRTVA